MAQPAILLQLQNVCITGGYLPLHLFKRVRSSARFSKAQSAAPHISSSRHPRFHQG
jgi:hypothetical protein